MITRHDKYSEKPTTEPSARPSEQCESTTGGGRYRCAFDAGHKGLHRAAGVHNVWSEPNADPLTDPRRSTPTGGPSDATR